MTLDEAIKHARDKSKVFRDFSHFEKDGYHYINLAEEQVQLAEWLEELKDYRRFNGAKTFDNGFKQGEKYGYNKAIDNVVKLLEELKEYKGLEEQGLLKKFKCAIGDTVYRINSLNEIYECTVQGIKQEFNTTSYFLHADINRGDYSIRVDSWFDKCQIGYEFYLTKEEAEQELKRLGCAE